MGFIDHGRQAILSAEGNTFSQLLSTTAACIEKLSVDNVRRVVACTINIGPGEEKPTLECLHALYASLHDDSLWKDLRPHVSLPGESVILFV